MLDILMHGREAEPWHVTVEGENKETLEIAKTESDGVKGPKSG